MKCWGQMSWSSFYECWVLSRLFHFRFSPSSRGSFVSLCFLPLSDIICMSEVVDISPSNLDSSLGFTQPSISHASTLNKQGDNIQPGWNPLLILNQSIVLCPVLTTVSWPAYRFLRRQVRWSDSPISLRIFQFAVIHTVKGFSTVVLLILFVTPIALLFMLSALFAEPRVGKAWAKRLEEDSRGLRNCRHIYPLPADTAAITTYSVALLSWLTDGRSRDAAMMLPPCRWSPCIPTAQTSSRPSESLMARVGKTVSDLSCYITIIYKTWGETVFLANLLSPLTRQRSRSRCFAVIPLLFLWFNRCWHSDLWFSFFSDVHMEVLGSHTVEAEHEGFWTLPC